MNQDQDVKPQSGTSSIVQNPKSELKGHGCSFHLQNQDRELKSRIWLLDTSDHIKIPMKIQSHSQEPP